LLLQALEPRVLLSGFAANINFQPMMARSPAGYQVDVGDMFRNRSNGYSYGWTSFNYRGVQRYSSRSPDLRYDTFVTSQPTRFAPNLAWKLAVPNGLYNVHIVAGDANNTNAYYATSANGQLVISGKPTSTARWVDGTATVAVSNGMLTLTSAAGATNNKLDFIQVSDASPTGLSAVVGSSHEVDLTWVDNANGERGYTVQRSSDGVTYRTIATLGANTTTFADKGLADGATYYYQVNAFAGGTSGVTQASAAIPLVAPTGLAVTGVAYNHADLSWTNQSTGATGYIIQNSSDGQNFQTLAQVGASVNSYQDTSVTAGTTCYYRVCAVKGTVQAASDVVSAAVPRAGFYASDFGAVGDGVTNDAPALQAAIDAAPAGATLYLQAGKTYLLNAGLVVDKALNFEGNGATLLLNTSTWPQNETLLYRSAVSPTKYTWTQPVAAGQTTFQVAVPVSEIAPGDMIDLQLGQDPNDSTQPHYERVCKVVANTGSSITIDQPIPYDINQGTRVDSMQKITSMVENSTIRDVRFDYTSHGLPDTQVWIDRARNMTVQNLSGRFSIAALVTNSQNVSIDGIKGELKNVHSSAGRALNVWQSDNVSETNVDVTSDSTQPAVFLESWAHKVTVTNFRIAYSTTQQLDWVFAVVGGSSGVYGDQIYIDNAGLAALVDSGGGPRPDYHFGTVTMTGPILHVPLDRIDSFRNGATVFSNPVHVDMTIPLSPGANGPMLPLVHGTIKSMTVIPSSTAGINMLYFLNQQYQGWEFSKSLVAGQPDVFTGSYGSVYPYNSLTGLDKYLAPYTSASLPTGTTLAVSIDYYPGA
jgi:hypothetical protein